MEKKKSLFDSLSGLIGDIAWRVSATGCTIGGTEVGTSSSPQVE